MKQTYNVKYKIGDIVYLHDYTGCYEKPYEIKSVIITHRKNSLSVAYAIAAPGYPEYEYRTYAERNLFLSLKDAQAYQVPSIDDDEDWNKLLGE